MSNIWEELAERIRGEADELDRIVRRTEDVWKRLYVDIEHQDIYLDSVALNLHGFYSGIEKLFEIIANNLDKILPTGKTWHRDLLQKMTGKFPECAQPSLIPAGCHNWMNSGVLDTWFVMYIPLISFRPK